MQPKGSMHKWHCTLSTNVASGVFESQIRVSRGGVIKLQGSIKESKEWFMACAQHAYGLAAMMALHQQQLPSYEQQLHVIYLANDVLLKR